MPKAFSFTESQLDAIVGALETEISAVHNETLGEDAELGLDDVPLTEEDVADASRLLVTLLRTLEKIDPEHPLATAAQHFGDIAAILSALDLLSWVLAYDQIQPPVFGDDEEDEDGEDEG